MVRDDKPVKIIEHSARIEELFTLYEELIRKALPKAEIIRIGSFAVPMRGKSELDVLIEVEDLEEASRKLSEKGFGQGPIRDDEAFLSNYSYEVECEVHLVPKGSKKKERYLSHVRRLREDDELRAAVETLKKRLDGKPRGIYREEKAKLLEELYKD